MADGTIVLKTQVDQSGLKKGISAMKSGVSSLTGAFKKLAGVIGVAFSVSAVVAFSKSSSELATQTEANVQRLIDIYGKASTDVGDFIDQNAMALGMSKASAASFAAVYGNLFSVWADQSTNAQLTNKYLQMTSVVAAKTGRTVADVQERIRSGLLGNTEAIEDLGVFVNVKTIEMTDAFKRMANGKSWAQLDAYAQQQIRSMAILEQATAKYGEATLQTSALVKGQFSAAWQDFQATWGQVVNRVLIPALDVLTQIVVKATELMRVLFNISGSTISQSGAISEAISNQQELTEAVEETDKAVQKNLASFDDLRILSGDNGGADSEVSSELVDALENASTVGIGSGSDAASAIEQQTAAVNQQASAFDVLFGQISRVKDIFMSGFWEGFAGADFSRLGESISSISDDVSEVFNGIQPQMSRLGESILIFCGNISGSISQIFTSTFQTIVAGLEQYLDVNKDDVRDKLGEILDASSRMVSAAGRTANAFADVFSTSIKGENAQRMTTSMISIFSDAALSLTSLAAQLGADVMEQLADAIDNNKEAINAALEDLYGTFADSAATIEELFGDLWDGLEDLYNEHFKPLIETLGDSLSKFVGEFVDAWRADIQPVLDDLSARFEEVVDEHVKPALDKVLAVLGRLIDKFGVLWRSVLEPLVSWIINVFVRILSWAIEGVGDIFLWLIEFGADIVSDLMDVFDGLIDFFEGVFTSDWEKAWEGIKAVFTGVINTILDVVEGAVNLVIEAINLLIGAVDLVGGTIAGLFGKEWSVPKLSDISIPRLAQGAVIPANKEFLAVLGDQKQGTNIEAPLQTIVDAFNIALEQNGRSGGGNTEVILQVDGREFGRAVVEQGNRENRRIGTRMVVV